MLFNSYIFALLFLPLTMVGYFFLCKLKTGTPAHIFLLCMSLWFYGYFNISYLPIIIGSVVFNYGAYKLLQKAGGLRTAAFIVALLANVGVLFYFKYFDFFIENVNAIFNRDFALKNLVLPLGISFFTFQQLSFIIDAYRGETGDYGFLDYALFVTYFPQLIAGPIVTHDELVPQFMDENRRHFDWDNFSRGLYQFALGMGKKVLLADTFGNAANWGFSNIDALDSASAIVVMLSYTIQIYFDFSGYCDMAVGVAKMMNIDLPQNFDSPYKALTITEFWDRWHMTLTRFFTRYVYIPLGGSRRGKVRTYINTMIVFLVSGLWHGASWTFVLWGALHGVFTVITKMCRRFFDRLHPALNWLITFGFVNAAWILFRADTIGDAVLFIKKILLLRFTGINENIVSAFNLTEFRCLFENIFNYDILGRYSPFFMVLFFLAALLLLLGSRNAHEKAQSFSPTLTKSFAIVFLLIWCIFSFSGVTTFLYFNF